MESEVVEFYGRNRERREAAGRSKGSVPEWVPAITVIVDGGWSKRSHRHTYNASSGVTIIIRKETGKLLFFGVRNKYCTACARNTPRDKHTSVNHLCTNHMQ